MGTTSKRYLIRDTTQDGILPYCFTGRFARPNTVRMVTLQSEEQDISAYKPWYTYEPQHFRFFHSKTQAELIIKCLGLIHIDIIECDIIQL